MLVLATKSWASEVTAGADCGAGEYVKSSISTVPALSRFQILPNMFHVVKGAGNQKITLTKAGEILIATVHSAAGCVMPRKSVFFQDEHVKSSSGEVVHIPAGYRLLPKQTVDISGGVTHILVFDTEKRKIIRLRNSHEERLTSSDLSFLDLLAKEALGLRR